VYRRLAAHCVDPEHAFVSLQGLVSHHDLIRGRLPLHQLHEQLVANQGLCLELRDFEAVWREPYSELMPGMADLIVALSQRYQLVLLSNVDKDYWEVVRAALPVLDCFRSLLVSWELGFAKPDPEMFMQALKAARREPARCFFIDDKLENVEAARKLGIDGHRFLDADDLRQALRDAEINSP
jgi:HAD superfamily hydrolase (TIGR01509 family)